MKNKKLYAILTLVAFMITLMPIMAFANEPVANSNSIAWTSDNDIQTGESSKVTVRVLDKTSNNTVADPLYVWVTKDGSSVPVETVMVGEAAEFTEDANYVWTSANSFTTADSFAIQFLAPGSFRIHVSATAPNMTSGAIANAAEFNYVDNLVNVSSANVSTSDYQVAVTLPAVYDLFDANGNKVNTANDGAALNNQIAKDNYTISSLTIEANNVAEKKVTLELQDKDGKPLTNHTLSINPVGAIDVSKETVTTNALGQATFNVSGNAEGTYKIFVTSGSFEFTIEVKVGAVAANSITTSKQPTNPTDILGESLTGGIKAIEFKMYDVNNNLIDPKTVATGWEKAAASTTSEYAGYVSIVSQPSASKLENKNLAFNGINITSNKTITAEGTYTFKVVLDNGNFATATMEVKAFTTPVSLVLAYPAAAELGATIELTDLYWLDANNVQKDARATLAATGYAISNFNSTTGELTLKSDEKYVGNTVTITAIDERYNLTATTTVTVADEASALEFATKNADVHVNNKIRVNVVDSQGNIVSLGNAQGDAAISYVILDKPAGAKVFASTVDSKKLTSDGYFDMNLTSDTVGNVTVQAMVKYAVTAANGTSQVKYYTGSQTFSVGNSLTGDVVVMTIGANDIVINDTKVTVDAAPMVKDGRTVVPFRALAEAFGADVAYENGVVTATLNGITVTMAIDATEYTVNDEVKTADVAPFISADRTFVPVRFVAEAFGITVTPIYDANGATASVLFNM